MHAKSVNAWQNTHMHGKTSCVLTHVQILRVHVTTCANSVCVCILRVIHQFCMRVKPQR